MVSPRYVRTGSCQNGENTSGSETPNNMSYSYTSSIILDAIKGFVSASLRVRMDHRNSNGGRDWPILRASCFVFAIPEDRTISIQFCAFNFDSKLQ
jgi:hypothetical protein